MSSESSPSLPEPSSKGIRKRVRKRRSESHNFMSLSRDRLTWAELLKTDRKFVALVSLLLIVGALGLVLLPRFWRSSPPGVFPVLRMSGLDLLRVRWASRQAAEAMARGDYARASEGWRGAIIANAGAADPKRRFLELCVLRGQADPDPEMLRFQLSQSALLLRLTRTNRAEVELAAAAAHAAGFREYTQGFLKLVPTEQLSPDGLATLAANSFEMEDWATFREIVGRHPELTNPVIRMQQAVVALISRAGNPAADWARIETPGAEPTAGRLRLVAAAHLGDEVRFDQAWGELERAQAIRPRDHVYRWRLLTRLGRTPEALTKAQAFDLPASNTSEAVLVLQELDRLGLASKAIRFGGAALTRYRMDPLLWREVGRLMVRSGAPEQLLGFAGDLRRLEVEDEPQPGFAAYCLGVAEHKLGNITHAAEAFGQAAVDPDLIRQPWLALECADTIRGLGYPEPAERIVQTVAHEQGMVPGFWTRAQVLAREARSASWLLDAARREYQANPKERAVEGRYLDALLLNRTNTADALALATARHRAEPANPVDGVAFARALLLHDRWAEADRTLAAIPEGSLRSAGLELITRYKIARGEALVELDQRRDGAKILSEVDPSLLFLDEVERFQLLRARAR